MQIIPQTQTTTLKLLAQGLSPMPYAQIGKRLLLLTAIQFAEANENGTLTLSLISGETLTLSADECRELNATLKAGIEAAQAQAARAAAQQLGLHSGLN